MSLLRSLPARRSILVAVMVAALLPAGRGAEAQRGPTCQGKRATLVGSRGPDRLRGTKKRDVIVARGGDDVVTSFDGEDVVCAGGGNDRVESGIDGDLVFGGQGADVIDVGRSYVPCIPCFGGRPDVARGGPGSDRVLASGIARLLGGPASDRLRSSGSRTSYSGGRGGDEIVGRGPQDTITFASTLVPVTVDLSAGTAAGEGDDRLTGIENATGSRNADLLIGSESRNIILGGLGDDDIEGNGGDDFISGEDGDDRLDGGAGDDEVHGSFGSDAIAGGDGIDLASFAEGGGSGIDVDLEAGTATGRYGSDSIEGIEHVEGTDGADTLDGDEDDNWLVGLGGSDDIDGRGGDDLLESGTDQREELDGGEGVDTLSYRGANGPVTVDLVEGATTTTSGTQELTAVENVVGSEADDDLLGDDGTNLLEGELGNDFVDGRGGADRIWGGTTDLTRYTCSDVIFNLRETGDVLRGGDGNDWITADDDVESYPYCIQVEPGSDEVYGDAGDDALFGQGADDALDGGDGVDAIDGGDGRDTCTAGETENACEV